MDCCTASSSPRSPLSPRRSWEWLRPCVRTGRARRSPPSSLILTAFAPAAWAQIVVNPSRRHRRISRLPAGRRDRGRRRRGAGEPAHGDRVRGPLFRPAGAVVAPAGASAAALAAAFYRSGALVFGGGHVVLPLLRAAVVDPRWVSDSAFLAGYGAAQAVPGPLFTFAAYLGAVASVPPGGIVGAALALVAIFAPGLLLLMAALVFWPRLRTRSLLVRRWPASTRPWSACSLPRSIIPYGRARSGGRPISPIAAAGFVALVVWRAPPLLVVVATAAAAALSVAV